MPDTFSMSFLLAGIYYGTNYLDEKKGFTNLLLFFGFTLTGILSKLPSAYLLAIFLFFIFDKEISWPKKINFVATIGLIMLLVSLYYFYWVPYLVQTYGFNHFFMGKSIFKGFLETFQHLDEVSEKFYLEALQIIGFVVFIVGLVIAIIKKHKKLLWVFAISFSAFLVIIFKAGFVFYHHSYYIIPFAPVMALVAAYAIEQIPNKKMAWILLLIIALENVLNKFNDYQISDKNMAILNLENDLDKFSKKNDLILINSKNLPTPMYFAHRRGWVNNNETISNRDYIEGLKQKGLKFIVILKKTFGENINLNYSIVFENEDYAVYKI